MKRVWSLIILAFLLWTLMFSPWTAPHVPFWWTMAGSALTLTVLSLFAMRMESTEEFKNPKDSNKPAPLYRRIMQECLLGITIAIGLWCVFWVGNEVSQWIFPFARPQVNLIYGMKAGENPWVLSLLLLFLIGPAEEIFWRGYVQRRFMMRYNANMGFIITTACYTLVHIASLNFMLIMSSLVCGVAWGGLYRFFPRHLPAIILSHALWDAAVFVWFPI
ncbi:MAG: CPBP family intramembrane metalloprotease [Bacteroidaceae bacterium]|nr:CPBP family intramembrane metalloprotease [Bacteroidaceae bacterium]